MKFNSSHRTITPAALVSLLLTTAHAQTNKTDAGVARGGVFVNVVQQVEKAVLPIYFQTSRGVGSGSAALFHPDGYALTNSHVARAAKGVAVFQGERVNLVVVGRLPEKDIAVIRLTDPKRQPWPYIQLGNSANVLNGESVAVLGNPGGRGTVVTGGIVSAKNMFFPPVSALVMTYYPNSRRERFLQYDAATNMGNSGGPLINMDGDMIGIVAALLNREQNTSFAIPIDRVREYLPTVIASELSHQRWVGIKVDPHAEVARVQSVDPGSPAQAAEIAPADIICSVNGDQVSNPSDWLVKLDQILNTEQTLTLSVRRGDDSITLELLTQAWPVVEPLVIDDPKQGLVYEFFEGEFDNLPNFDELRPTRSGHVRTLDLDAVRGERRDRFAIRFTGFLKVDSDGLYRITITSDDGTRLLLDESNLIEHDGVHPRMAASHLIRLKKGAHPVVLEYFQKSGDAFLGLSIEMLKTSADFQTTQLKPQLLRLDSEAAARVGGP